MSKSWGYYILASEDDMHIWKQWDYVWLWELAWRLQKRLGLEEAYKKGFGWKRPKKNIT